MRRYLLTVGTLVVFFVACNSPRQQENAPGLKNMAPRSIAESVQEGLDVEPNGTVLQALDVTLAGDVFQWSGGLDSEDVDVWKIKGKTGTVADIIVIPESDFELLADYSGTGNDIDRKHYNSSPKARNELLPNIRLTPQGGYLTVRARLNGDVGKVRYRVMVTRLSPGENVIVEGEINERRELAMSVAMPANVEGTLFPSGDVDYYRLPLGEPANVEFVLPEGAVEVAIENGDRVVWSAVSRASGSLMSDLLIPELQEVLIRVTGLEPVDQPLKYRINITSPGTLPDEIEPNNTVEKAQLLQGDPQNLNLSLMDEVDVDIYKLIVDPSRMYRIRLAGIQQGQAYLQPVDSNGNVRGDVLHEELAVCGVLSGDDRLLLVRVIPGVSQWPLNYRITVDSEDASGVEREPNQTNTQAHLFELGKTVSGHIFPAGDVDYYRIELPSYPGLTGPVGKLSIDVESGYVASLGLKLTDSEGYEVGRRENSHLGKPMRLPFDAPGGNYFLEVSGSGDRCLKPYRLKISFEPSAEATASLSNSEIANKAAAALPDTVPVPVLAPGIPKPEIPLDDLIKAAEQSDTARKSDKSVGPNDDEDAF